MLNNTLFKIARKGNQVKYLPSDDDKENVVSIYNGILCSHKNEAIVSFEMSWMELKIVIRNGLLGTEIRVLYYVAHHVISQKRDPTLVENTVVITRGWREEGEDKVKKRLVSKY